MSPAISSQISGCMIRRNSWFIALLLIGVLPLPASAVPAPIVLKNSIREVEVAPQTGKLNPHRPFITRRTLTTSETDALMEFEVSLKMRNFAELQDRVAHGERISANEVAAKYDPVATDYAMVSQWLTNQGFTITHQDTSHLAVFAQGTVSQIQAAFQTSFARVAYEGVEYTSAVTAPSVPATMSSLLVGINGLQPQIQMHKHLIARPSSLSGTNPPYLPSQIAQAYNASGLYSSSITGSGQTIAIAIDTFPNMGDLTTFWSTYGVSQSSSNITFIQVVRGTLPAPSGEETLDTEWSSSIAPGASVRVYAAKTLTSSHLDQVYEQIYTDATKHPEYGIHQMSMSYGIGETYTTSSQVQTDDQYFVKLASAGVTPFASAGDGGSTPGSGSAGDETGPLQAESPATDPNVTSVGGTSLLLDLNGNESSEAVWDNSYGAGGGGISEYFNRPYWQFGNGVPSGTMRLVPDISCSADPLNGAVVILNNNQLQYGGTSWSSPTWAGFCALLNQVRANASQSALGSLGPYIYPQLGSSNFRDITSGSNSTGNSNGLYAATAGYDIATGIGVPNVQTLAQTLQTYTPTAPTAPIIATTQPPSATTDTTYSFTFSASGYPPPTFTLLSGNLPPGLSLSSNGVISGTPTASGVFSGTVSASNGVGSAATFNFTITITDSSLADGSPTMPPWGLAILGALLMATASKLLPRSSTAPTPHQFSFSDCQ